MRTDEQGNRCPATIGEYRDLCAALWGDDCAPVRWLDGEIAGNKQGRDGIVLAADDQVRVVIFKMIRDELGTCSDPA